ncbi:MAG: DinB family protein [Chloroflexota bacterium]
MADWDDLLSEYLHVPEQLEAALQGLSEVQLNLCPRPEEWSIRQIVHHIVDGDDLWALILKQALGEAPQELNLQWYWEYPQENWGSWWAYAQREIAPSLALLRASREHITQLLRQVPNAQERSIGVCWPNGEREQISVPDIIEMQTSHISGHSQEIRAIREQHGI